MRTADVQQGMTHQLRSRRMALLASAVVLGLTACGAPSGEPVTSDGGPARLQLVAGGSGGAAANESAVAGDAAKMMMPAFIDYVYSGEVPDLTGPAGSWYFPAGTAATAEQVQRLATAFGVAGPVEAVPADQGGGWRVGPSDWTGPSVQVSTDGMLSWWFNPGPSETTVVEPCVLVDPPIAEVEPATDAGAAVPATEVPVTDVTGIDPAVTPAPTPICPAPEPPAGVPDAATAEARARELFAAFGLDLSSYELETYADEWGAYVTAYLRLDGVRTWLSANVGFGAEGAITWAGGFLAQPQRGDDYPRIGVEAAVARLNDQSSMWMYPMSAAGVMDASVRAGAEIGWSASAPGSAEAAPPPADTVPAGEAPVSEELPVEPPATDVPMPVLPPVDELPADVMPVDTTPIVVTLTSPSPSLEMFWAADGTVWLLPGYRFATSDGGEVSVLAVPDEFIEQATPVDTVPVDSVPVDSVPVDTTPVDTVDQTPPMTLEQAAAIVVGLAEADAAAAAAAAGIEMRVVQLDGVALPVTEDYRIGRYNVSVDAGVVTAVLSNG